MGLQLNEINERLKSPLKKDRLIKAIRHENRLRFHVESFINDKEIRQPLTEFMEWVRSLIPKDKFNIFARLFMFPTPIIQLTNSIFYELERVFEGKNPVFNYQFTDSKYRDDWAYYRNEVLKSDKFWKTKGWQLLKTNINSVMVIDMPPVQVSEFPEPYFYSLGIEHVIDYAYNDETDSLEWIMFRQECGKIACFDDTYFRVFSAAQNGKLGEMLAESAHNLGFCPAKFFWGEQLSQSTPDLKKSPLTPQLANLDWLLFFSVSKRHLDLYAPYPIYSAYEEDCDYSNSANGDECDGGYLRGADGQYRVYGNGTLQECPICSNRHLAGAGSFVSVPIPVDKTDSDLRSPVQITTVDKNSLDYNHQEVSRLKTEIMSAVIGLGGDIQQKQSLNETQISANYESKTNVLNDIKSNFEEIIKFVDDTCCLLRYGANFVSSSISLGTDFYIFTVSDLYAQYKQAKENGASEAELDSINNRIIETEHRNDVTQMQRLLILKHLEPYRHYTFNELMTLKANNLLDEKLLKIKLNFATFVDRFERENINIIEFGNQLDFNKKIGIITTKFNEYVTEQQSNQQNTTA